MNWSDILKDMRIPQIVARTIMAAVLNLLLVASAQAESPLVAAEEACRALSQLAGPELGDPTATITASKLVPVGERIPAAYPGAPLPPPLPLHCEIFGKLEERIGTNGQRYAIRFHLRLPVAWNGRFYFAGGGGANGIVGDGAGMLPGVQPGTALGLGYATVTQDSGHDNATNSDPKLQGALTFGWDPLARRNFGYASIGKVTHAAKTIIRRYYGRQPAFSYFVGGSKGGQEAFMAAQRFGSEFDGVLAGYPGFRLATSGAAGELWDDQAFAAVAKELRQVGSDGLPLLGRSFTDPDLALVQQAVLASCDDLDGLKDGMVLAFSRCTTSRVRPSLARITCSGPKNATCLLPIQIAALIRVFDGARDHKGRPLYAAWPWDAGIGGSTADGYFQGWRAWKIGSADANTNDAISVTLAAGAVSAIFTSPPTALADTPSDYARYALNADIVATEAATRMKSGPFAESGVDFMNADSTDLTKFSARGGKLLVYHGVSDPVFSIEDTIGWLNAVNKVERGKAARFVRLFPVPGMNHGGGGPATDQADFFSALVAWRERGIAPTQIVGTSRAGTNWPGRTRLLCAYPAEAHYVGGDGERGTSFACR